MPVLTLTKKECAFLSCAHMILRDECPPERKYYLCMRVDDDSAVDCTKCWCDYLWAIGAGTVELPGKGAAV